jgi:hypothetical protein
MNEEGSLYPHFAVMIHFTDDDERELFDADENSDFEIIGIFDELEPAVELADKFHRRYVDYESVFTVELMHNSMLFTTVYFPELDDRNLEELKERAAQSWKLFSGLITKQ